MKDEVSIVLPIRNAVKNLPSCIESLQTSTNYPFKLLLIENGSTDNTLEMCNEFAKKYDNIEVYHNEETGFVKAINFGIKKAGDNHIYITQDDVIHFKLFNRDWLKDMVKIYNENKDRCAAITSIGAGGISGPSYIDKFPWAGTWSLFLPKQTIKEIGLFDEEFNPGDGDDIDYSYRIYLSGKRIFIANFWVDHHRESLHLLEEKKTNMEHANYFRKKWGLDKNA